ncbi:MAG: FAD-dependent oxidoreductase [Patescibacteria group bacterium]
MNHKIGIIIGAGPAGMAASFELHKAGKSFIVIEKNNMIGGLTRTFQYGEFKTDIGPHRFFSQNSYLYNLIEDLLGNKWIKVNRLTRFYINGKFFLYPVEIKNVLLNVGLYKALKILFDYLWVKIKSKFIKKELSSFKDYVIADFGRTLAELNILNYTEKIWGLACSEISPDWAKQRIKGLSLREVIKNALTKSNKGPKTLIDQFYYPDLGAVLIYEKIKERILDKENIFKLNSCPVKIFHNNDQITKVIINIKNNSQIVEPEYVISSMPITEFVHLLEPAAPNEILEAVKNLKFRSHVSLFITLDKPSVFSDQWIYFSDKKIPFSRIMEPKNFSKKMSPQDKTSLLIEFFCWENDKIWNADKEELLDLSIEWLEKLNFIRKNEIINCFVHKEKYAYPVYDLKYKGYLEKIKNYLSGFKNLQLIGRGGSFRYNNQDHSLEMGILAARSIIDGKQYNIENVGLEQKYFERGYIK